MGRLFLREFEDPDAEQYLCKGCYTPIALHEDCTTKGKDTWLFEKAINFVVDDGLDDEGASKVSNIRCIKCDDHMLGFVFVEIGAEDRGMFEKNNVALFVETLLKKQGNDIVDALPPDENAVLQQAADPPLASEITIQPQPENPENAAAAAPSSEITIQPLLQNLEIANAPAHDQNQELEAS